MNHEQAELFAVAAVASPPPPTEFIMPERTPVAEYREVGYQGMANSATYLANLYLSQERKTHEQVDALIDATCTINPKQLSKLFAVQKLKDDDDQMSGVFANIIYIDSWAEGDVNWQEIATLWTEDMRYQRSLEQVPTDVTNILATAVIEGNMVTLTCGQLDPKIYQKVDQVLKALGGKWNRKLRGHLFEGDPTDDLETMILTGRYVKPENFGFFPTPRPLAEFVVSLANLRPGQKVLEPEAGTGALLSLAAAKVGIENVVGVELQEKLHANLVASGYTVHRGDFLSRSAWDSEGFDAIVMNPPFAKQADIDHVLHAWTMLKPGGRLVSIMAANIEFRTNRKTQEFREFVAAHGTIHKNPEGSFSESGTTVNTVTIVLDKP